MAIAPFRPVKVGFSGVADGSSLARDIKDLQDNFKAWTLHMSAQSGAVLYNALKPTFDKSQTYVPIDTGDLKKSGYLEVRRRGLFRAYEVEIGYGRGGFPSYAIYVHETPIFHKPPTRWKFLQAAISEDGNEIQKRINEGFKTASGT
jgi:hypothetical protein